MSKFLVKHEFSTAITTYVLGVGVKSTAHVKISPGLYDVVATYVATTTCDAGIWIRSADSKMQLFITNEEIAKNGEIVSDNYVPAPPTELEVLQQAIEVFRTSHSTNTNFTVSPTSCKVLAEWLEELERDRRGLSEIRNGIARTVPMSNIGGGSTALDTLFPGKRMVK